MNPGQMLAHYRIEARLGAGGMGVVYKALDTHLNRPVAIKVLAAEALTDPARRQRFIQEAHAASALDHPNIVTIYDIAEAEGQHFMVMQFVAGKTLRALLSRGRLDCNQALRYGVQIADALAQAHARGIVHRDLKPENLMVTEQDQVKILDFGLALLTAVEEPDDTAAGDSPTLSLRATKLRTEEGTVLGTVAYMSPEQAEGKRVDARSDIFSLGAVLYEMVTGRRPFQGDSKASTTAAILREDPKPVHELAEGVPAELERVIARCLRKDRAKRFQHMDDLKVALEEIKEESESGRLTAATPRPRRPLALVASVALIFLAAAALWWGLRDRRTKPASGPVLTRLTSDPGLTTEPALSSDGKLVVYASDRAGTGNLDLWVQQLSGGEPHRLTEDLADDHEPEFSPDGGKIAFRSEREGGGIYVVSTFGGTARKIANDGRRPRFSPDGSSIAYWVGERMNQFNGDGKAYVIPAAGGAPRQVLPNFRGVWNSAWSPDGKYLIVAGMAGPGQQRPDWWVVPASGGAPIATGAFKLLAEHKLIRVTITAGSEFRPVPSVWTGDRIVFAASLGDSLNLWQVAISPKTFQVAGVPQRLTSGTGLEMDPSLGEGPQKTRLVFSTLTENADIWSLALDPNKAQVSGEPQRLTQDVAADIRPSIDAAGAKLVFNSNRGGNWDLWLKDLSSGRETALTSTPIHEENPRITPDGTKVAYRVREGNTVTAYTMPLSGGVPQKVTECGQVFPWAADGRRFLCSGGDSLSLADAATGERKLIVTAQVGGAPRLSWDNRWVTFYRAGAGRGRIYVAPVREDRPADEKDLIAVTDGSSRDALPEFSPDGSLLYFMSLRDGFECLWVQRVNPATKTPQGAPFPVYHFHTARRSPAYVRVGQRAISIARDKIVFTMEERAGNIWMAELDNF